MKTMNIKFENFREEERRKKLPLRYAYCFWCEHEKEFGNWNGSNKVSQKFPSLREDLDYRTAKTCESDSARSVADSDSSFWEKRVLLCIMILVKKS